jgi:hypothetical protein
MVGDPASAQMVEREANRDADAGNWGLLGLLGLAGLMGAMGRDRERVHRSATSRHEMPSREMPSR